MVPQTLTMSTAETASLMIDAWKFMVGRFPDSAIEHSAGLASAFANLPLPFLNISILDKLLAAPTALDATLTLAKQRATGCDHPTMLALPNAWLPADWEIAIAQHGFALAMGLTGMAADELLPPRRPLATLEFRRILDDATAIDLGNVNALAYGMSAELFACIGNLHLWHPDTFGYVGYKDGQAVTAAAALPVAGTMYIALVATLPDAHGKGYAEAVLRHTIDNARQSMGDIPITLHASDMGHPVYSAMGFQSGARVSLLMPAGAH